MTREETGQGGSGPNVRITRPGMRPVQADLVFACPNFYVVLIDGVERTLPARDGAPVGFTITEGARR
jgi:hypothetical protein